MANPPSFPTIRLSTADLPERDRIPVWREHYGRMALRIDIEPAEGAPFDCALVTRKLPDLQFLSAAMSPVRVTRPREFLSDGNDDLTLIINQSGAIAASGRRREVALGDGDAILISSSDVAVFDRYRAGGSLSFRMPRPVLSSIVVDVDDALMRPIPRHAETLKLLTSYATPLLRDDSLAASDLRRTVVAHVHDLVALTLGATRDAAELATSRGMRAARLRSAKAYVAQHSHRRDISVTAVAAHLGVTPRYVQRLFESEGDTFSAFLLNQRLVCARRMLTAPKSSRSAVSAIAYDVGFNDLSYFHRCFKRHFGATPRDIRDTADGC